MRAVLWDLLLLCLFAHVLSDCQRDCLSCDRHMYSQWDGFNVLVCVLECEGQAVPRATWELCAAASAGPREEEEEDDDDDYNDAADAAMARPFEVEEAAGLRGAGPRPAMAAAVAAAARRAAQRSGTASRHLPPGTGKIKPCSCPPSQPPPHPDGPQSAPDSHAFRNHFSPYSRARS
ncbi:prepronociceptin isoform X2 [Apteryx mantelli]|uniref:Prepronociceptin isoform X2 n=1 Tax=Apteryx mantelli TaxID=2696672 RepID=A0ABM4ECY4_9AVES